MAGIPDDSNTPDELLLVDVRDLIAQVCKSPDEAERLIIEFARKGGFTHVRCTGGFIDPRHWGLCHEGLGSFTPVDFDNSRVRYIRVPADQAGSYLLRQEMDELLARDFYGPSRKEMRLVRLWRSEALALLRWAGLPLPVQQTAQIDGSTTSSKSRRRKTKRLPTQRKKEAPILTNATKAWVADEVGVMLQTNAISPDISITDLSKELALRMKLAAKAGKLTHSVGWDYIKHSLPIWGLWPLPSRKRR